MKSSLSAAYAVKRKKKSSGAPAPEMEAGPTSIVEAIRKRKKMSEGGEVSAGSAELEDLNEMALDADIDEAPDVKQPWESNRKGREILGDLHDRVGAIRKKMKSVRED